MEYTSIYAEKGNRVRYSLKQACTSITYGGTHNVGTIVESDKESVVHGSPLCRSK